MIKGIYWHTAIPVDELSYEFFKLGHFIYKPSSSTYIYLSISGGLYVFGEDFRLRGKSFVFYGKESLSTVNMGC